MVARVRKRRKSKVESFYGHYLRQHKNRTCRRLHFLGTTMVILTVLYALFSAQPLLLLLAPLFGYAPAWIGHFFFEKNKPATFDYPLLSLICDFKMYKDMLTGKIRF